MNWGLFPNFANIEQAAEYIQDHFRWSLRDPTDPGPRSLSSDYHSLCPRFDLKVARRYAHGSHIPEMVQVIFYAMVIDDAAELGLFHRLTMDVVMWAMRKLDWGPMETWLRDKDQRLLRAQASHPTNFTANLMLTSGPSRGRMSSFPSFHDITVEYVRDNLRWSKRETSSLHMNLLPWNFYAMQFAHATHILEMVQAVFYVMVISDAARLRLIKRETGESLMSDLRKLRWDVIEVWLLFIKDKLKDAQ
ncbi:LOW QUALITY PROTEIN: hypothetical protein Cgig2_020625 [Carnegiea gigantea]|uniref:Uncharacterized protein n=1 Tax=Carnegiea gigantea TaxID=171969 RepID=A0A9Q1JXU2_9CARY|nr:LOW QUALITY PROTEIN: hypothetical protein Cgig2_020625 [Carnegiea gigantea]